MYTALVNSKFTDLDAFAQPVLQFLGINQLPLELSLIPTLITPPEDENKSFSLKNNQIYKESLKCSYQFMLKLSTHLQPISDANKLCTAPQKKLFKQLVHPFYQFAFASKYRIIRAIAQILASIFGFQPLFRDICPGIRAFLPSKESFADPDADVRLQALLQKTTENSFFYDDNEVVRTFSTAMAKKISDVNLILGGFQGARIFALCSFVQEKEWLSKISAALEGQSGGVIFQISQDIIAAFAVLDAEIDLQMNFERNEEICIALSILTTLNAGITLEKKVFAGFDQKQYNFDQKDKIKQINQKLSNLQIQNAQTLIPDILSRIQSFQSDSVDFCFDLFFEQFIEQITDNPTLKQLCEGYLTPAQMRKLLKDDANYAQFLNKKLVELTAKIAENKLQEFDFKLFLNAFPTSFPDSEEIKLFFSEVEFGTLESGNELFWSKNEQLAELLFVLLLRLKEGGLRDTDSTKQFQMYLEKILLESCKKLFGIVYLGITEEDKDISFQIKEIQAVLTFLEKITQTLQDSASAFKGFQNEDYFHLQIVLYSVKYYLFTAQDYKILENDEIINQCQNVQQEMFQLSQIQNQIIISAIDIPLFKSSLNKVLKSKIKQEQLFTTLVFVFKHIQNFDFDQYNAISSLQKEFRPDTNLPVILSQEINQFIKQQKTDLKKVKKEWIKISLWCKDREGFQFISDGLDSQEIDAVQFQK